MLLKKVQVPSDYPVVSVTFENVNRIHQQEERSGRITRMCNFERSVWPSAGRGKEIVRCSILSVIRLSHIYATTRNLTSSKSLIILCESANSCGDIEL